MRLGIVRALAAAQDALDQPALGHVLRPRNDHFRQVIVAGGELDHMSAIDKVDIRGVDAPVGGLGAVRAEKLRVQRPAVKHEHEPGLLSGLGAL